MRIILIKINKFKWGWFKSMIKMVSNAEALTVDY